MKRLLLLLLSFLFCAVSLNGQEIVFKEGMKNTRPVGAWYKWTNQKDKMVNLDKVRAYAQKHNILIGECTTTEIGRFGDVAVSAKTVEFIPMSEFPDYLMENILDKTPISSLSQSGSFLYYEPKSTSQLFNLFGGAKWSGSVVNGRIDGQGAGVLQVNPNFYIGFKGLFKEGVPIGKVDYYTYSPKDQYERYNGRYRRRTTAEMGTELSDDRISIRYNFKYGFIDKDGHIPVKPEFDAVTPFRGGVATASIGKVIIEIDTQGRPLRLNEKSDRDLSELLYAKANNSSVSQAVENTLKENILSYGYDDLATIAKEFPAISETVKEAIKKNISSYTFPELLKLDKDFPSLASLSLENRTRLYNADCQTFMEAYQKAVAAAGENRIYQDDYAVVSEFRYRYGEEFNFDPDKMVPKADAVMDYYTICDGFRFNPNKTYVDTSTDPPYFEASRASGDLNFLAGAWTKCNTISEEFKSFAEYARPRIEFNGESLDSNLNTQYYKQFVPAFEKAKSAAFAKLNSLKTYKDLYPYLKDVDEWNVVRDYDNSIFGGTGKLIRSHQTTVYTFDNGIHITVTHDWDSPEWTSHPKNLYYSVQVTSRESFDDCIVTSYQKEKKKILEDRYKGTTFFLIIFPWE